MLISLVAGLGLLVAAEAALGQGPQGTTGADFLRWSHDQRVGYLAGFIEGWLVAGAVMQKEIDPIGACLDRWTFGDAFEVITKFLERSPEQQHQSVLTLAATALRRACGRL
ncbi:MAG: hypothetical protein HYV08_16775 [Deltaproteobacteria bacterium]|nr:hypothetical protein [Deltaproteobacteria bacterium]MBI3077536.1 hypothetical protein [Deltaproteobacteria bacterium]